MILLLLAYIGGVLTILSPCILPVLPFVFARSGQPFVRSGLPLLLGMAATFALVATLAAVGGGWAVQANQYGRYAALLLLALFGLTLLFPSLSDHVTRPLVALGNRLSESAQGQPGKQTASVIPSLLLGVATGLLWAPCAGPILGLLLTGAALEGASGRTTLLLFAYALGAATSLAGALLIGGKVFAAMKRSLGVGEWVRRGLGLAVIAGVAAIALGLDTGLLTRLSLSRTASIEQALLDKTQDHANAMNGNAMMASSNAMMSNTTMAPNNTMMSADAAANGSAPAAEAAGSDTSLPVEGTLPSLSGAVQWLNSPPLTTAGLRGKVVLVDFWTYSCINCLRTLPYIRDWADKYRDQGLVVIGVHAPEFAFEKDIGNVRQALKDLNINYPVAIDNNYAIWRAFENQYWPAHYFIDAQGRIRHHHFGEGGYDESERVIQQLLAEAGHNKAMSTALTTVQGKGVSLAPDDNDTQSPETYVGYARAENFAGPGEQVHDTRHAYAAPENLSQNQWGLAGQWNVEGEKAVSPSSGGRVIYRFHARDLHLVLGPSAKDKPVRFRVLLDGAAPGASHGMDTNANGEGTITGQRLYQLIRQQQPVQDRTFDIEFLDPGAQVFSFTFG